MTAKEAFEAQEILKEFRKGLDSLSESKLIGALDLAIEALKVQDMTLYMNLPEVSAEEAVEILKRNNRIELIPSGEDTNVPNTDTISRQATITEIKNYERDSTAPIDYVKIVEQMPPAQPDARYINANELIKRLQQAGLDDAVSIAVKMAGHERLKHVPSAQPEIIRKPVIGYEGYYEVDNCGRVYALDRVIHVEDHGRSYDKPLSGGIIKQHMHSKGYKIVPLTKDGKTKNIFVHRIVAMAFLANPDKLPCINHKDEDKTNNFVENLEWCTYQYNNAYGSKPKKHSKRMSGRKLSDEHKQHISDGHKRHWDKIRAEKEN